MLFKCWLKPSVLERSNSDKSGNTKILRTTLFGLIMSDYYRSKISLTEKNIDTNTSHQVVKVYCDAVHGLSFHIGTIGEGNSWESLIMNNLFMRNEIKSPSTDSIVEMIDFLTEDGKCSTYASELEIKLLEMTLNHLKIRIQQIVSGVGRFLDLRLSESFWSVTLHIEMIPFPSQITNQRPRERNLHQAFDLFDKQKYRSNR